MVREACASRYEIFVEVEGVLSTGSDDLSATTCAHVSTMSHAGPRRCRWRPRVAESLSGQKGHLGESVGQS